MVTPAARLDAVAYLKVSFEVSERRACAIIAADRSTVRYRARRPDNAALRARLRELADQRRRFGYRRLHLLLRGEGWTMNQRAPGLRHLECWAPAPVAAVAPRRNVNPRFRWPVDEQKGSGHMFLHLSGTGVVDVGSHLDVAHRVNDSIVVDVLPAAEMTITLLARHIQE
jgi:transposase InsO family protein